MIDQEAIKRIVAYQFDRVTNLTEEAYQDSLQMIAGQINELEAEAHKND